MKTFYISTPIIDGDSKKTTEAAKRACAYFRLSAVTISPVLALDYLERGDWLFKSNAMDLMTLCTDVYVFTDEVTEFQIAEIKKAQKLGLPVHFYDADRNEINYDALVINHRIGPGYRKMIAEAHGETCCSGTCPYGSECCTAPETKADKTVTATAPQVDKPAAPASALTAKGGFFSHLFGKVR